ncbi:hypothetical protein BC834DRAFT_842164 [Gloeopeniophorella convolvens]|nr:hypothetical protein BC834DRAFT_842164 [Gloeopeniophorella convolvens]
MAKRGKWTSLEDDELLRAFDETEGDWDEIAASLERAASDCRDRYIKHLQAAPTRRRGTWTDDEEQALLSIMRDLAQEGQINTQVRGFWKGVSKRMNNARSAQQCQNKWYDSLEPKVSGSGDKTMWSDADDRILITRVALQDVDKESDVDWKGLRGMAGAIGALTSYPRSGRG